MRKTIYWASDKSRLLMPLKIVGIAGIVVALTFGATGCSKKTSPHKVQNETKSTEELITDHNAAEVYTIDALSEDYTLQEICDGYLRHDPAYERYYKADDEYCGWIWVSIDSASNFVAPRAVYSKQEWTPEEILQSFQDNTEPWAGIVDDFGDELFYLWSQDYQTKFCVGDGWLTIDGIESLPVYSKTYSMDPAKLIAAYQSGEWDGEQRRYSKDYSTYAYIGVDGHIYYKYCRYEYTELGDPKQVAYRGYSKTPAYESYGDEVCVDDGQAVAHSQCDDEFDHFHNHCAFYDPTAKSSVFETAEYKLVREQARSEAYVDLPSHIRLDDYNVLDILYTDDYTYVLTRTATHLYKRGHRIYTWATGESTYGELISICDGRIWANLYSRSELIPLKAGGFTGEVLEDVVEKYWVHDGKKLEVVTVQDGKLAFRHYEYGDDREFIDVADHVVDAKFIDDNALLYSVEDHSVYVLNTYKGDSYYLGNGELDDYYNLLHRKYLDTEDMPEYVDAHKSEL